MATLKDRIEQRLSALGLRRAEASRKAGLNPTYVRDLLEDRVQNPRAEHFSRLAEVLQTTPEWLLEGRGPETRGADEISTEKVLQIWDRIAPEDRDHALKALRGFARDDRKHAASKD